MNTKDLIRLAQQADFDGDVELADYLDNQLVRVAIDLSGVKNFFQKGWNFSRRPNYNVDFSGLDMDGKNLATIAAHPTQRGNPVAKFFQAGLKDKKRTPERLEQIGEQIKGAIGRVISSDPNVISAKAKFDAGKFSEMTPAERNALLGHLVNNDKIATRANDVSPDDIIKILSGQKPSLASKQVTTLSNAGKGAIGLGALGAGYLGVNAYNTSKQQAGMQPGSLYNDSSAAGSPFQSMPEMGGAGGGMPSMNEMPMGGGGGGYQGPNYNMPSANQSFQPMQGYQPANQVEREFNLPRTNDQAEPLYPRITSQQAMQNAMAVDKARRFDELMAQGNSPTAEPTVGPGTPAASSGNEFNFAQESGLRPSTPQEDARFQNQQAAPATAVEGPGQAVEGVGQAVDLSNPTGFNPQNPFNI